jgi:hypothetical protein
MNVKTWETKVFEADFINFSGFSTGWIQAANPFPDEGKYTNSHHRRLYG